MDKILYQQLSYQNIPWTFINYSALIIPEWHRISSISCIMASMPVPSRLPRYFSPNLLSGIPKLCGSAISATNAWLPSKVVQPSPGSFTKPGNLMIYLKSKMLMSEMPAFLQCATVLRTPWTKRVEECICKPDHLAPTKAWINWINLQKAWSVFPRFSCPLSPSFLQSFHSKWTKTRFAHCTTLFILVAANLHCAEHVKRLRDVRLSRQFCLYNCFWCCELLYLRHTLKKQLDCCRLYQKNANRNDNVA